MPSDELQDAWKKEARAQAMAKVEGYEGRRDWVYKDSKGKWTVGVGHLIGDGSDAALEGSSYANLERRSSGSLKAPVIKQGNRLNQAEIDDLYVADYAIHEKRARKGTKYYDNYSDNLKGEIMQAEYRGDWKGSPTARKLLEEGNYEAAAIEFLDNDDYRKSLQRGTGIAPRMEAVANAIREEGQYELIG